MKRILSTVLAIAMILSTMGVTTFAAEESYVAKIGETEYTNFSDAMTAANSVSGEVEVEIYGEVEFTDGMELKGSYGSITFVGKDTDAKISINQTAGGDYLEAHGKTVAFTDLTLAKANPAWAGNSGHMGNYFSVQGGTVTYTNCTFPNGACTSGGTATYNGCTFQNTSEYGLWVYDDAFVTVNGGTIDSTKGIKVYSEDEATVTSTLTVQNATFTEKVTAKPAVAIGYAESITLIGNTYNNTTGVLELDSGSDADCEGVTFVAQDAEGNDIAATLTAVDRSNSDAACGVLVDGKIYTTVATAVTEAESGSTVTLLFDSAETVELPEGVTLDTNGYTAENVTVAETEAPTPAGNIQVGYVTDNFNNKGYSAISGEAVNVVATESFVVKMFCGETIIGTTALNDPDKILLNGVSRTISWHAPLTDDGDSWWITEWVGGALKVNAIPNKVELWVDGIKVSEGEVKLNNADDSYPVVAAKVDADGVIEKFITAATWVNNADYAAALNAAFAEGGNIVMLRDVTLTEKITVNNDATLDLNGKTITTSGIVGSRVIVLDDQCMSLVINANGGAINSADDRAYGIIDNVSCADVTINGGTYDFDTDNGGLFKFRSNAGTFTLNDITVETNAQVSGPNGGNLQELVVNGGTFKAANDYNVRNVFAFYVEDAKATFDGVTITNEYIGAIECSGGEVTVNDCNISVTGTNSAPYLSCAVAVSGGGKVTVDGGTYTTKPKADSDANGQGTTHGSWTGIIMSSGGTMIVNGGTFSNGNHGDNAASNPRGLFSIGADADYGDNVAANLQINGGTFNSIGAFVDCETIWGSETDSANTYMPTMDVAITGGDFTGVAGKTIGGCDPISTGNPVDIEISGGIYGTNNMIDDSYLADGYVLEANSDGTYGVQAAGLTGTGTEADPYLINNLDELIWFRDKVDEQASDGTTQFAGKYFKLTSDIDLAGIDWNPIGSMSGDHGSFKGVFDGNGKTISNLTISSFTEKGAGLFARTAGNAEIKNLTLNNVTISSDNNYVGGVVANSYASTKITNVHVTGNVKISGRGYIGGISGHGYVVMDNVSVKANEGSIVTSSFWCCGGILGYGGEGATDIKNAYVENLTVTSAAGGLGAIVGMAEDNNGTQPISGSNLSAKNVDIKTYVGDYGTGYEDYAMGYLYGGNPTSELTGTLTVEDVTVVTASGNPASVNDAVAQIGNSIYFNFAEALIAAKDGETVELIANEDKVVDMNGAVYGKTVTITGTATVDWSKGFLFVGRGGEGDGTLIFDNANLTSSTGIHVSGREKNTTNKYDGTLIINNSTIELDYLINKGTMTLDNSTLTVKNGFSVGGRPANETEDGVDATATITLNNNSKVIVNNHNGMGLGYEAIGVMNVNSGSTFECTQSFLITEKGTMNVNGGTVDVDGTLTNNGTINVSGTSDIVANVSGDGWVYMDSVTLDADTKLDGAKVRFASGTNNIDGSVINDGFFQVGVGSYKGVDANVDTTNGIIVNVKNANIGSNGDTYAGWVGTGFYDTDEQKAAAMTDAKYVLNIENSIAEFGYLHISNDGEINVKGNATEKAHYNNSDYSFYGGDFIINGVATFDATDVLALYTKVSCDNGTDKPGTLNIINGTYYEAERHNGAIDGTNFVLYKTGVVNVDETSELYIGEYTTIAADTVMNIGGKATALGTITNNGKINLTTANATLTTPETSVVNSTVDGYDVVYADGTYSVTKAAAPAAPAGEITGTLIDMNDPNETFIASEIIGLKAEESVVIKTLDADKNLLATTTLQKPEYFNIDPLSVKIIITGESSSWKTVWEDGNPVADKVPAYVDLWVDDTKMNTAETNMASTGTELPVNWADVPGVNPVEEEDPYADTKAALSKTITRTKMAQKEEGMIRVGMYAGIDSLDYAAVGIRVYDPNVDDYDGTTAEPIIDFYPIKKVYEELIGSNEKVTAEGLGVFRIFGFIQSVPESYKDKMLHFEAYAKPLDGSDEIVGERFGILIQ